MLSVWGVIAKRLRLSVLHIWYLGIHVRSLRPGCASTAIVVLPSSDFGSGHRYHGLDLQRLGFQINGFDLTVFQEP